MNDTERRLFDAAEHYANHRSIPRAVKELVRQAFRMGAHWQREQTVTPITPPTPGAR